MLSRAITLAALLCSSAPQTEDACYAAGGSWERAGGKAGGNGLHVCYFSPTDVGKRCRDFHECQTQTCVPDGKHAKSGKCSDRHAFGCHPEMHDGQASKMCRD